MPARHHVLAICETCPLYEHDSYVPSSIGSGPVAIVGMAPDFQEVRLGRPFVGPSGKLLAMMVEQAGAMTLLGEATLANAVCCRPPSDKVPARAIECCSERLRSELEPASQILALGREASKAVTGSYAMIADTPTITRDQWQGRRVLVAPHPAAVLRAAAWGPRLRHGIERVAAPDVSVTWEWPPFTIAHSMDDLLEDDSYEPVIIDTEYTGVTAWDRFDVERVRCVGFGFPDGSIVVAPGDITYDERLDSMLQVRGVVGHAVRGDQGILDRRGIETRLAGDTILADAFIDERPGGRGLESLCARRLGLPSWKPQGSADERSRWYAEVSDDELYAYNARDVAATMALRDEQQRLGAWDSALHKNLLIPASELLRDVEDHGIGVDDKVLAKVADAYKLEHNVRRAQVEGWFGPELNPGSWQQILAAYADAGVVIPDTSKETLRDLIASEQTHPKIAEATNALLRWRKTAKALSTYLRPLQRRQTHDGRVHARFNEIGTETGRLSSSEPNMQNWPRANQPLLEGLPDVRGVFWAGEGRRFVRCDLSQAELRVIAVESGDPALLEVCRAGDLHAEVASRIGRPRVQAKAVNFGIPFGLTEYGLQHILGLGEKESQRLVSDHRARFPGVWDWQDRIRDKVAVSQHLETPFGRKRHPLDVSVLDRTQRSEAEREMLAFTSQAVVSDITLLAAIDAHRQGVTVVCLIHDDVMVECDEEAVEEVAQILTQSVRDAGSRYTEAVDFPAEIKVSTHWS